MYGRGIVFGDVVRFFVWAWFTVYAELALFGTITDPMESRVRKTRFILAYVIVYNTVRCGVICFERSYGFGCFWTSSCSVLRTGTPSLALMNISPYSASAEDDRTIFIILQRTNIGPFGGG